MSENNSITITRALVELKTLDSRISKAMRDAVFLTYKCNNEETPKEKVTENRYQQITDLIEYRKKLKGAIVRSNAATTVVIGKKEYTAAEAIERKSSIEYERKLLNAMKTQLGNASKQLEVYNEKVQGKLDGILEKSFGSSQKGNLDELKSFSESYLKTNRAELVDPLNLSEKISKLEDQIVNFSSEVDLILSESNATTRVVV